MRLWSTCGAQYLSLTVSPRTETTPTMILFLSCSRYSRLASRDLELASLSLLAQSGYPGYLPSA